MGMAYMDTDHKTNPCLDRAMSPGLLGNHLHCRHPTQCLMGPGTTHILDHHDNYHKYYSQSSFQLKSFKIH